MGPLCVAAESFAPAKLQEGLGSIAGGIDYGGKRSFLLRRSRGC